MRNPPKDSLRAVEVAKLSLTALLLGAAPADAQLGVEIGAAAPGAMVETLDGRSVDLATYIGRKPVVLQFWALWCGNCRQLEPAMRDAHKRYGDRVEFIGVAVSVNQSPQRVRLWVERHQPPFITLYDRRGDATGAYDVPATSYIVVIDAEGRVVYTGVGGDQDIDTAVRKALD